MRNNKRWKVKGKATEEEAIIKILLQNRGLKSKKEIKEFFNPPLPWSEEIVKQIKFDKIELDKAIKRIKKAIKNKESIIVYGDYDADGICATAIVWEALHYLRARVLPFIPLREEHGYGLSKKGIDEILSNGTMKKWHTGSIGLIITVDNGIVAHKAVDYARSLGIDVIITDHHQRKLQSGKDTKLHSKKHDLSKAAKTPPRWPQGLLGGGGIKYDLPQAEAIIWSDKLSGAGVAWYLTKELIEHFKRSDLASLQGRTLYRESLDLVAIGTVADLMPILGPNRSIIKYGLDILNKTKRIGLEALLEAAGLKKGQICTWQIGYIIAPRLNAMGRLNTAIDSLRLLCTRDKQKAEGLAQLLGQTNKERQQLTLSTFEHAKSLVYKVRPCSDAGSDLEQKKLLFVAHESYNQGVIGLVAGKLVEEFYKPAVVVSRGKIYSKASVRSINGFNIIQYLRTFEDYYEDIGGHPMAAGFTIKTERLEILQEKLEELAEKQINPELLIPQVQADCEIDLRNITHRFFEKLKEFEPFGMGNQEPNFVSKEVEIASFRQVGREGSHLKLSVQGSTLQRLQRRKVDPLTKTTFDAIAFNHGHLATKLSLGQKIDILYCVQEDSWNGNHKLQLKIRDIKLL